MESIDNREEDGPGENNLDTIDNGGTEKGTEDQDVKGILGITKKLLSAVEMGISEMERIIGGDAANAEDSPVNNISEDKDSVGNAEDWPMHTSGDDDLALGTDVDSYLCAEDMEEDVSNVVAVPVQGDEEVPVNSEDEYDSVAPKFFDVFAPREVNDLVTRRYKDAEDVDGTDKNDDRDLIIDNI